MFDKIWPLVVTPSSPFCEYEVGEIFEESSGVYRLLYRDATKVKIVHMNWFTRIFWGEKKNGNGSKATNGCKRT